LAVEIIPGKHCDFSNILGKRASAQSGACAEVQFPDYGTVFWSPDSRIYTRKLCVFNTQLAKRTRAQSGEFADVQFPDF
jgi:hypothetical protein